MELIINTKGEILGAWFRKDGCLVHDRGTKYGYDFAIGVEYTEEQKSRYLEIKGLKKYLSDTDYKALKYADGAYTEEEYRPWKEARAAARATIKELEFEEPTLTPEQIETAERLAMEKLKKEASDADM